MRKCNKKLKGPTLALAVVAIALLALCAPVLAQSAESDQLVIGFASRSLSCAWWESFTKAGVAWGESRDDVNLIMRDAEDNVVRQVEILDYFIQQGVDGIILQCVDSNGVVPGVERAVAAGIPVATVDVDANSPLVAVYVAFGNKAAGTRIAEMMVEKLIEKNGAPVGNILELQLVLGMEVTNLRNEGFMEVMDQYPDITVYSKPAESSESVALQITSDFLQVHEVDAIYGQGQPVTEGAFTAIKNAGLAKKVGEEGHIIIMGVDDGPMLNQLIEEGWIDGVIDQPCTGYVPLTGDLLVEYIRQGPGILPLLPDTEGLAYWLVGQDDDMWSPATLKTNFGHPYINTAGFMVTQDTADNPNLWARQAQQ